MRTALQAFRHALAAQDVLVYSSFPRHCAATPDQNNPSFHCPPGNSFCPQMALNKDETFFFFLPGQQSTPIVIQDSLPCTYIEETMRLLSRCRWRQQLVDIHTPSALKSLCDSLSTATATLDSQGSGTSMSIPSRAGVICSSTTGNVCKGSLPPLSLKSCGGHC